MTTVEERVDRLEEVLVAFIEEAREFRRDIHEGNARIHLQLAKLQQQADKDRAQASVRFAESDKRWEQAAVRSAEMDKRWEEAREEREKDREEAKNEREAAAKEREQEREEREREREAAAKEREREREETHKERKDFNRRMAEITDSMGRMVEDMVVPNASRIAREIFENDPVLDISSRVRRKRGGETMELDLMAAGQENLMVAEGKWQIRPEDPGKFLEKLKRLPEFFPEYACHRIVPVLASLAIEPSMVTNLSKRRIYGLAFGDETMDLVNLGQF